MKALIGIFLVGLAIVLGVALSGPVLERWNDSNATQRQLDALQIERESSALRDWQAQQQATAMSRALASNGFYLLTLILGGIVVYALYDGYQQRRRPLIKPDRFGQLPVARAAIEDGEYKALVYQVALEVARYHQLQAIHQPGQTPQNLHQHISQAPRLAELPAGNSEIETSEREALRTFAQLLDTGRVGKGNPLLLGYDLAEGTELTGSWLDLYSTVVAGMSGTGKTTTQRFLACQTALHGARFAIIDPHAGAAEDSLAGTLAPLASAFVCEPASSDKAILDVVRYVADVGRRRIEGKDSDTTPLILWADELTSLLGRSAIGDELAELLERIAQEYRKRWVFVCGSGQIWTASRATSELRDSFASVLCHRMKRSQARLLLPTDEAEQVERLAIGTAVLWRTSGDTQAIAIPNTTAGDVARVGQLLSSTGYPADPRGALSDAIRSTARNSGGSLTEPNSATESSASGRAAAPSAIEARILALFLDGNDAAEIVRQLWPDTKPGRATQDRSAYVQATIRQSLRGAA